MSTQYVTEPPPTAAVLLHTTAGSLTISLFAQQTPLTTRNFLQHCIDGSYDGNIFHRVAPGFVIQTGDPTGTGEGGQSIYEDREFERYDKDWAAVMKRDVEGEKIEFGDEIHSRLKFNRRGLVGMAKGTGQDGGYRSQFFITLGDCRAELDGKCTMFGRVEGDGIYNVVKVAEGERIEDTERPMYPEKILNVEIMEMPRGAAWEKMSKRVRVAARTTEDDKPKKKSTASKKKGGKALLSFGGDEGEEGEGVVVRPKKAKFNTALINNHEENKEPDRPKPNGPLSGNKASSPSRRRSVSPLRPPKRKAEPEPEPPIKHHSPSPPSKRRKPSFHDSTTQLPLRDPESPSRSPSPASSARSSPGRHRHSSSTTKQTSASLEAEIAKLKQSMRRPDIASQSQSQPKPKSALESLIPSTSTRGRRRPRPGETIEDKSSLKMLNAFRTRLEKAEAAPPSSVGPSEPKSSSTPAPTAKSETDTNDDEEAALCDLHFIANCQSCFAAEVDPTHEASADDPHDRGFLSHSLTFEKDRLGKDLTWKRKNEEELVVIDPRERERELGVKVDGKTRDRDKVGDQARGKGKVRQKDREWDRRK